MGALVIGLVGGAVYLGVQEAKRGERVAEGKEAPAFIAEKYGGGQQTLEEHRGKVVMLDFWATWCPPCVEEMPSLVSLAHEYESRGLVFVAANRDDAEEQKAAVGVFIARTVPDLGRHVVFASDEMSASYRVESLPTLYLIGRDGQILQSSVGFMSEEKLRSWIEEAVGP
jgi:thiol-disulfide isomerase/thioredoxin